MKKNILFFLCILSVFFIQAQVVKFEKIYGGAAYDHGYAVIQGYDKGYIVAGATSSFGAGGADAYILKTDSMGVEKWHKTFGGINVDYFYSIKKTNDWGYIIAGYTNSFGAGGYDAYLVKIDSVGNVLWSKTYGGTSWDFAYSVSTTTDGGYILCGGTYSYGKGDQDMYVIKTNAVGDTIWTKTYGGTNEDNAKSVIQTSDGGYVLTGMTKSLGDLNGDIYTIKINALGDTVWTKKYGGPLEDFSNQIIESVNGNYMIAGSTKNGTFGDLDGVILKYSANGTFISNDFFGGTQEDGLTSVSESPSGKYSMVGHTYSYGWANGTSDFVWYRENILNGGNYGGNKMEKAYCINNTADKGYIICGYSNSYTPTEHIYLIKTDSNNVSSANVIVVPTAIDENNKKVDYSIQTYPNPVNDFLNISFINSIHSSFRVTINDIIGRAYLTKNFDSIDSLTQLNTSALPNGIYMITLQGENFVKSKKIVIQH